MLCCGSRYLPAAQAAVRSNPDWKHRHTHLAMRRQKSIAKVAMGRRLAVRWYWMWRREWDYRQFRAVGWYAGKLVTGHGVNTRALCLEWASSQGGADSKSHWSPSGLARLIPRNTAPKDVSFFSSFSLQCFSREYSPPYPQFPHRLGTARLGTVFCFIWRVSVMLANSDSCGAAFVLKVDLNRRLLAHRLRPESNAAALSYSRKEETSCLAPIDRTLLVTPV